MPVSQRNASTSQAKISDIAVCQYDLCRFLCIER